MPDSSTGFQFSPEWRISLATALLLPFLVGLGFWQMQRAEEKELLKNSWEQRSRQSPARISEIQLHDIDTLAFMPVIVTGTYVENSVFLLDNKMHERQFGYEVLAIVEVDGADLSVVVNRGWIVGDPARLSLPEIPRHEGPITFRGHVYVPRDEPYLLSEQSFEAGWPKRIQALDMDKIAKAAQGSYSGDLFPHVIRLDSTEPSALTVDWKVVNVSPQKHNAYAFQWFAMALFLAIFYLLRSTNLWQLLPFTRRKTG